MLPLRGTFGDRTLTDRKIPRNPRYASVESVVDSGSSLPKHVAKLKEKYSKYKYRQNELFKRIKATTLGSLMLETAYEYDLGQYEKSIIGDGQQVQLVQAEIIPEDSINMDDTMIAPSVDDHPAQTYRSNFTVSHVIQADVDNHGQSVAAARMRNLAETALPALPFLLLDVRDEEEYERGHIVTALHYPRAMLSRASNMFTKEILQFRNQEDKLIIIYDVDETAAAFVAQQFAERDIQNVWMLSGGLKAFHKIKGVFVGEWPVEALPPPPPATKKKSPAKVAPALSPMAMWAAHQKLAAATAAAVKKSAVAASGRATPSNATGRSAVTSATQTNQASMLMTAPPDVGEEHLYTASGKCDSAAQTSFAVDSNATATQVPTTTAPQGKPVFDMSALRQSLVDATPDPTISDMMSVRSGMPSNGVRGVGTFSRAGSSMMASRGGLVGGMPNRFK